MSEADSTQVEPPTAKLVFLIPTRNRSAELLRCIDSIAATVNVPETHILVGFDDDATGFHQFDKRPYATAILLQPRHYFVRAMNRLYLEATKRFPGMTYFVVCNDDDTFVQYNWGNMVIDAFQRKFPDNLGLLELFIPGRVHCYITHVDLIEERGGLIYDPKYTQYYADQVLCDELREQKRYLGYSAGDPQQRIVTHNSFATDDALAKETWVAWYDLDTFVHGEEEEE